MHLSAVIEGFFIARRTRLAPATLRNYRYATDKLLARFGPEADFAAITADNLRAWLDTLRSAGLSEHSIHDNFVIAAAVWTFAAKELGYPHVARAVQKPKFPKPLIVPFADEEIRALLRAAEWSQSYRTSRGRAARNKRPAARRDVAIILTLLDTGLRVSELCGLEMQDYTNAAGRLYVRRGKGDKQRFVFLGARAHQALWRYLADRQAPRPSDPIFATRTQRPLERNNVRHLLLRIGANAGIPGVHPHRFRHTFAIQFLRNGGNVFELQRILGHESLETVRVYLALAEVDIAAAQRAHSPADGWRL